MTPTRAAPASRRRVRARGRPTFRRRRPPPQSVRRRRRALAFLTVIVAIAGTLAALVAFGPLGDTLREIALPLRHEDIIRQQAADKDLDPALIAAVIYEESKFRDQTSSAGARGLMQITPATAEYIAKKSGGIRFEQADLATPQVNIAYGSWYLRYLLRRYDGDDRLAIAAYNAGETNVDHWIRDAGGRDRFDPDSDIPFAETRTYVRNVRERRGQYRKRYKRELGLD